MPGSPLDAGTGKEESSAMPRIPSHTPHSLAVVGLLLMSLSPFPSRAASGDGFVPELSEPDFYDTFIAYRLSVGVTYTAASMRETTHSFKPGSHGEQTYLGHIYHLSEDTTDGVGVLLRYECTRYLGIELGLCPEIKLGTWNNNLAASDGEFTFQTYYASLLFEYPIDEYCLIPYAGAGIVKTSVEMKNGPWWTQGYPSPSAYRHHGEKTALKREMTVKDPSVGFVATAGLAAALWRNVSVDVFVRYFATGDSDADVYCYYKGKRGRDHTATGYFPTDHLLYGAALRIVF